LAGQTTRQVRQRTKYGSWAVTALLAAVAWRAGHLQLWLLPLLFWAYYELCLCPTTCGIRTTGGGLCRNPASGRLYACKARPAHSRLKNDALIRMLGIRRASPAPTLVNGARPSAKSSGSGPDKAGFRSDSAGFGSQSVGYGSDSAGFGSDSAGSGSDSAGFGSDSAGYGSDAGIWPDDAGFGSKDAGIAPDEADFGPENATIDSRQSLAVLLVVLTSLVGIVVAFLA
jgi:hypothetical protein